MARSMAVQEHIARSASGAGDDSCAADRPRAAARRRVALILPAHDEEAAVDETMESILASTRIPDEVIVADGMSRDRTVEKCLAFRARGLPVRVVPNPAVYPGAGRNAGARATECEILLFADFGNQMDRHWIERMVAPLEESEAAELVTGVYHALVKIEFERCAACINYPKLVAHERLSAAEQRLAPPPNKAGGNIACARALWARAGGVPGWLRAAEDKLFVRKLAALGARSVVARDAVMNHHMRSNAAQVYRQYFHYGRGDGQTGILSPIFIKLLAIYGVLLGMVGAAPLAPALPFLAVLLFAVYIGGGGIRKLRRHDALRLPIDLFYAAQILLARDCGTLAGTIAGWVDWALVPRYRRNHADYLRGTTSAAPRVLPLAPAGPALTPTPGAPRA